MLEHTVGTSAAAAGSAGSGLDSTATASEIDRLQLERLALLAVGETVTLLPPSPLLAQPYPGGAWMSAKL